MRTERLLKFLALACCCYCAAAGPASAALHIRSHRRPRPLITIAGPHAIRLALASGASDVSSLIPIRFGTSSTAQSFSISTAFVHRGTNVSADLVQRFRASLYPRQGPVAIELTATNVASLLAGEYHIMLLVRSKQRTTPVALTVAVPVLTLGITQPVKFAQTLGFGGTLGFDDQTYGRLRLTLPPGSAPITQLTVTAIDQPSPGTLTFTPKVATVDGRQGLVLTARVAGFSVGNHMGTLEIRGQGLAAPVTVSYAIVVTRSGWWIVAMLVGGFLTGLIVRKLLAAAIAWLQGVRAAYGYGWTLKVAESAAADLTFRNAIHNAYNALQGAIGPVATLASMASAVEQAKTAYNNAVADYELRQQTQAARLQALRGRVTTASGVAEIDELVAQIRGRLDQAAAALAASNPDSARAILDECEQLLGELGQRAVAWQDDAEQILDTVATAPVVDRTSLQALADTARQALHALSNPGADPGKPLGDVRDALPLVGHVVRELRNDVAGIVGDVASVIDDRGGDTTALRERLVEFQQQLSPERVGARGALVQMRAALTELQKALRAAVRDKTTLARADADALLAQGKPMNALGPLAPKFQKLGDAVAPAAAPALDRGDAPTTPAEPAYQPPPPAAGGAPDVPDVVVNVGDGMTLVALIVTVIIRTVLLTGIFSIVGWLAYHQRFTGTTEEMLGIFLWAFTTDLTIEGVSAMAQQRGTPPPAPGAA